MNDMVEIAVYYRAMSWLSPFDKRMLGRLLGVMLAEARKYGPVRGVELNIMDDAFLASINQEHMQRTGPTNIISFPGGDSMPGILFLSLDAYARERRLYGQDPAKYLLRLLAHGFGHLAGYGHGLEMEKVSDACMSAAVTALCH